MGKNHIIGTDGHLAPNRSRKKLEQTSGKSRRFSVGQLRLLCDSGGFA
jgi:hypothetical protein